MLSELTHPRPFVSDPINRLDHLLNLLSHKHEEEWPLGSFPSGQCPMDIWEDDAFFVVEMEMPGAKEENIDVSLNGHELSVSVDFPAPIDDSKRYIRQERTYGTATRVIRLPMEKIPEVVDADFEQGLLRIRFRKP